VRYNSTAPPGNGSERYVCRSPQTQVLTIDRLAWRGASRSGAESRRRLEIVKRRKRAETGCARNFTDVTEFSLVATVVTFRTLN